MVKSNHRQALNICVTDGREYTEIMNSVKSIFFFATPHGGSAVADSAASFAAIANFASLGLGPFKSSYFKTLKIDSRELYDISLDFRYRAAKLNIYSFLEERAMVGFKLVRIPLFFFIRLFVCSLDLNSQFCRLSPKQTDLLGPPAKHWFQWWVVTTEVLYVSRIRRPTSINQSSGR